MAKAKGSTSVIRATQVAPDTTPMALIDKALSSGLDIDRLGQLFDLQERWEKNKAKEAYVFAITKFKKNPPEIYKTKHVSYANSKGGTTEYDHATLGQICDAVIEGLSKVDITHNWKTDIDKDRMITVKCVLTHSMGHSEETSLWAKPDESGGKNSIQAIGSTVSYLQRYTLLAATGLAVKGVDDDAMSAGQKPRMTDEQIRELERMAKTIKLNPAKICRAYMVKALSDIPAEYFDEVKARIQEAGKASRNKG